MSSFIRRRPILSAIIGLFVLVTLLSSIVIVPETKQAVIVRFGKPIRILGSEQAATESSIRCACTSVRGARTGSAMRFAPFSGPSFATNWASGRLRPC